MTRAHAELAGTGVKRLVASYFGALGRALNAGRGAVAAALMVEYFGELLDAFRQFEYPNEIGPGVFDIHSPRVPEVGEMVTLLEKAAGLIPAERLWVNPDCGLKTRGWEEVMPALRNMVAAARRMRERQQRASTA